MRTARLLLTLTNMIPGVGLFVLASLMSHAPPALGQAQGDCPLPPGVTPPADPRVTAQQVEDGHASLVDFTLAVRDLNLEIGQSASSPEKVLYLGCLVRQEGGPYRSGSTYLVQLTPDGRVFVHAKDMSLSGRQLNPLIYATILQALGINPADLANPATFLTSFAAAGDGGAFDIPDVPGASGYAAVYISANFGLPIVLLAGFDLNESHVIQEEIDYGDPDITAGEVVDRESLKAFVTQAGEFVIDVQKSGDLAASSKLRIALRDENGPWRQGSVYLYVLDLTSNIVLFHGADPDRFELRPLVGIARDGVTGELILPQVLEAAKSSPEGGFVEYFYDDPADDTDSADIPKVGYAREFRNEFDFGQGVVTLHFIVGSGFYGRVSEDVPGDTRTAVEVTVLGEAVAGLALEFSRAVSGRRAQYAWNAVTDANGQASLTISSTGRVSGYYRARALDADGQVVGQWNSIPLNQDRRQFLELALGGGTRIVRVETLAAGKTVPSASGLGPIVPNPFNRSTQVAYHLSSPGPVRLVIYNILGQPVRTLVDRFQAAERYQVSWDGRDQQGVSLPSGVYITRLSYPGGVQTRRLLYLK